jgi:predicted permease
MSQITSIILPFFALIGLGWIGGKTRIVTPDGMRGINGFVFYFALPALLFRALATRNPAEIWQPDILLAYGGGTLVVYGLTRVIAARVFGLDPTSQTLFSFAGTMSNVGFMGLPLIIGLLGQEATVPLIVALAFDLIVMLSLSLLLLEGAKHANGGNSAGKIIRGTVTNPVVLAIIAGVIASILDLDWPKGVDYLLELLGGSAGPAALFAIGVALVGRPIAEKRAELVAMSLAKLVIHPVMVFAGFYMVGSVTGLEAKAVFLLAALPTAGNVFVVATTYDRYIVRSSSIVLVTTALGVITFSIFSLYIDPIIALLD